MLEVLIPAAILYAVIGSSSRNSHHKHKKNLRKSKSYYRHSHHSRSNSRYEDPDWKALSYKEKDWY